MEMHLAYLERYMKVCRADGQGPGYYDSFKNAQEWWDGEVDKRKTFLTDYWERVVKDAEKKRQLWSTPPRNHWLIAGTKNWRIVEPLDIAEYYKKGRKDYKKGGRSKHYEFLEKWPEDHQKKNSQEKNGPSNLRLKNIESKRKYRRIFKPLHIGQNHKIGRKAYEKGGRFKHHGLLEKGQEDHKKKNSREQAGPSNLKLIDIESRVTEDSCFWAHVEEAIQLLDSGELSNEFEEYVKRLINNCAVSPDIFLEKSRYMQWWREYEKILEQRMIGHSHESQSDLVRFMRNDPRKNYIQRSLRGNDKGAIWSVLSASLSRPFFLILPLYLLISRGKKLRVSMDWVSGSIMKSGAAH